MEDQKRFFFARLDGVQDAALASFLHLKGHEVVGLLGGGTVATGRRLRGLGARVETRWSPDLLAGVDRAVASHGTDPAVLEACAAAGVSVVTPSALLAEEVVGFRTIGVTGTHGKGTVAAMIAWILEQAGWEPGFVIGGFSENFQGDARVGSGTWLVVELDESCPDFHLVPCDLGVCNFLEMDHPESFDGLEDQIEVMRRFFEAQKGIAEAFVNLDCRGNRRLVEQLELRPTGYSLDHPTEYRGEVQDGEELEVKVRHRDEELGVVGLQVPGEYNGVNALGAVAVCHRLGISFDEIRSALASFAGLRDRFAISTGGGVTVIQDFVDHPTGIGAVLGSLEKMEGKGRIMAALANSDAPLIGLLEGEFARALEGCDEVVLVRGGAPLSGVGGHRERLASRLSAGGTRTVLLPDAEGAGRYFEEILREGDRVVFFGDEYFLRQADHLRAKLARRAASAEGLPQPPKMDGPLAEGDEP